MNMFLLASMLIGIGLLLVSGWFLLHLLAQNGRLLGRIDHLEGHRRFNSIVPVPTIEKPLRATVQFGDPISTSWNAPRLGYPAPPLTIQARTGAPVSLTNPGGRMTFILFWSPTCSFCSHILNDLRMWEDTGDSDALQFLIVSTGPESQHAGLNLRSPILLDVNSATMTAFGAIGTAAAVMIDANGNIASTLARSGPAVIALLKRAPHILPKVGSASPLVAASAMG